MKTVEHLIETFVPENYNIFLDINRQTKTFTGNVAINGEALDNHVAFHQKIWTLSLFCSIMKLLFIKWITTMKLCVLNYLKQE